MHAVGVSGVVSVTFAGGQRRVRDEAVAADYHARAQAGELHHRAGADAAVGGVGGSGVHAKVAVQRAGSGELRLDGQHPAASGACPRRRRPRRRRPRLGCPRVAGVAPLGRRAPSGFLAPGLPS
jgi:hypothetical protein